MFPVFVKLNLAFIKRQDLFKFFDNSLWLLDRYHLSSAWVWVYSGITQHYGCDSKKITKIKRKIFLFHILPRKMERWFYFVVICLCNWNWFWVKKNIFVFLFWNWFMTTTGTTTTTSTTKKRRILNVTTTKKSTIDSIW